MIIIFYSLIVVFRIFSIHTAYGEASCESNRPDGQFFQSAVCCDAPGEVTQSKTDAKSSIINIDKVITDFTAKDPDYRLMVDVTNYRRVELQNSRSPILLRRPLPVYKKITDEYWRKYWIFVSAGSLSEYFATNLSVRCKVSKFIEFFNYDGLGYHGYIYKVKFVPITRPWNQHISIHLHPLLQTFRIEVTGDYAHLFEPCDVDCVGVNTVHVLMVESQAYQSLEENRAVQNLIPWGSLKYFTLEIVYYYPTDKTQPKIVLLTKNHFLLTNHRLNVHWSFDDINLDEQVEFVDFIPNLCTHIKDRAHLKYFVDRSNGRRFEKILLEIFLSQVGNHTLTFTQAQRVEGAKPFSFSVCENAGVKFKFEPRMESHLAYIRLVEDKNERQFISVVVPDSDLRFISCRNPTYSPFAFQELVKVYDYLVWLMILVTFAVIIQTSTYIRSRSYTCLFLVKVALEQGDPLSNKLLKHKFSALIGVVVMLVGTVLTNGYKNANVYNMVLPRSPIAYQLFEELFRDQVKIYSRMEAKSDLLRRERKSLKLWNLLNITMLELTCRGKDWSHLSEIQWFAETFEDTYAEAIAERAHIASNTCRILAESFVIPPEGSELKYLRKQEMDGLIKVLKKCDKTAIILPYTIAKRVVQANLGIKKQNLNIGIQSFFKHEVVFFMNGMWPRFVIRRHSLIKGESGISNKLQNLLNNTIPPNLKDDEPSSAKLSGNIFVVFSVYLTGIGLSSLTFLATLVTKIFVERCTTKCFATKVRRYKIISKLYVNDIARNKVFSGIKVVVQRTVLNGTGRLLVAKNCLKVNIKYK